jgi:hypothetical protein
MGIRSNLFGRRSRADAKQKAKIAAMPNGKAMLAALEKFRRAMAAAASPEQQPGFLLVSAIYESSCRCTKVLDSRIAFPTEQERQYQAFGVTFAFMIFFFHMALREVFGDFGPAARDKVLAAVGPLLVGATADCFDVPEGGRARHESYFRDVAQGWEIEYSRCKGLMSGPGHGNELITGNSLDAVLVRNVLELAGYLVPDVDEHTESWTYADFYANKRLRCRYSANPQTINILVPPLIRLQMLTEIAALWRSGHVEKLVSSQ